MLTIVTPPTAEPVTLDDLKTQVRVDGSDEDTLLTSLITAARERLELETGRAMLTQTIRQTLPDWPDDPYIRLLREPVQAVSSITYTLSDASSQTLDASVYALDISGVAPVVRLAYGQQWPSDTLATSNAIQVTYTAGYGDTADDVPTPLRQAVLLLAAELFARREASAEKRSWPLPFGVRYLIAPYRTYGGRWP